LPSAVIVANKCDLASAWANDEPAGVIAVSSLTGDGIERLIAKIGSRLVPAVPGSGTAIPVTPRQVDCLQAARAAAEAGDVEAARSQMSRCLSGTVG
jgi:tRNA U34 5-carboxymethylaminomethyl modifying GTPase MnmE/TrmE